MTLRNLLDLYDNLTFKNNDGSLNVKTIVSYTSEILVKHGLGDDNKHPQNINGIWVYPTDVFCPMDHTQGCKMKITKNTVSLHLYDASWCDHNTIRYKIHLIKKMIKQLYYNMINK